MVELISAIKNYDTIQAINLINDNLYLSEKDEFNRNVLHIACETGLSAISQALLNTGVDFIEEDENGNYPLHSAVIGNDLNIIKKLIKKKHNPFVQNKLGDTPLHLAVNLGYENIVEYLISLSNIHIKNKKGRTALLSFSEDTTPYTLYLLTENEFDIYQTDDQGNNILHLCADILYFNHNIEGIVELAFMCGVDPEQKNLLDISAFDIAFHKHNGYFFEIFKEDLLYSQSRYFFAAIQNNDIDFVQKITGDNFNYNSLYYDRNALFYTNNIKTLNYLIDKGININHQTEDGKTKLHESIIQNNYDVVQLLIYCGADLNIQDVSGNYPIHYSLNEKNIYLTLLLLESDVELNKPNKKGVIPHNIIEYDKIKILQERKILSDSMKNNKK